MVSTVACAATATTTQCIIGKSSSKILDAIISAY